jgi:hypothetical protein
MHPADLKWLLDNAVTAKGGDQPGGRLKNANVQVLAEHKA